MMLLKRSIHFWFLFCLLGLIFVGQAVAIDTDGDGFDDSVDANQTTINANIYYYTILHTTRSNGDQVSHIFFAIEGPTTGFNDLSAEISGPEGSITFQDSDCSLYDSHYYECSKSYSSPLLAEGNYTLTVMDSLGNSVSQSDSYRHVVTPIVDVSKVRYIQNADGSYTFRWPHVDAPYSYSYRFRIASPVNYISPRSRNNSVTVSADLLPDFSPDAYRYAVEVFDHNKFGMAFNRSQSEAISFTANEGNVDGQLSAHLYNRYETDGIHKVKLETILPETVDINDVELAEVTGPEGFYYEYVLPSSGTPNDYNYFGQLTPPVQLLSHEVFPGDADYPLATGIYTFRAIISGVEYISDSTLTPAVQYSVPDSASWQIYDLENDQLRFRWADVNTNGYLYYRLMFQNQSGEWLTTGRKHTNFMDIPMPNVYAALGTGPLQWRVEVHDSEYYSTLRNRRNGPWVDLDTSNLPLYDPNATLEFPRFNNRYFANGDAELRHFVRVNDVENVYSLSVTGPDGYTRDLTLDGRPYLGKDYQAYMFVETESVSTGLYEYELTDSTGTFYGYDTLTPAVTLPSVQYNTVHVDRLANGDLQVSFAPVYYDSLLTYNVQVSSLTDHNGDCYSDEIVALWNQLPQNQGVPPYVLIPDTLPDEPLFIRIDARDASNGSMENNRSVSVRIGYEGPGFDYSSLKDEDNDGWASNIDPDDLNPLVYPNSCSQDSNPPIMSNLTVTPNPAAINTQVTIHADIDDGSQGGSNIASVSYTVDGSAGTPMQATDGAFDNAYEGVTATIGPFAEAGIHEVCVDGKDAYGNTSEAQCVLLVIYDPDGGFVTGGGWIESPAGAYTPEPSLTGIANFGFVAKYQKKSTVPVGQTEFQFKAAGLNFHSSSYDWLVVAGAKAQFKGVGTVNGQVGFGFMLTALDEALTESSSSDRFRIKIWDMNNDDAVVYDNELDEGIDADPTTDISGGSIVIHKPKGKK